MPASRLAIKLTGMSEAELGEYEIPCVTSRRQIGILSGSYSRSVRVAAGLICTEEDIDEVRRQLAEDPRRFIRERRFAARKRIQVKIKKGREGW